MIHHRRNSTVIFALAVIPFLLSCGRDGSLDPMDRQGLSRDDFRDMYDQMKEEDGKDNKDKSGREPIVTIPKDAKLTVATKAPPIPEIASILAAPRPPKIGQTKLVSISVTDDVPLKDVFVELSRLADVDIELDSGIEGGITFRAKERPFNEVIERISSMAGFRYSYKDGILRVERDLPFVRNYSIDFLNITRDTQSTYDISTDVSSLASGGSGGGGGGGGGEGGDGLSSGSSSSIKSTAEDDFWKSFEASIGNILASAPPKYAAMNPLDPRAATEMTSAAAAAPAAAGGATLPQGNSFNINRKAGVISLSATERQHEKVKAFIEKIRQNSSAQVLIEAKILEVSLNDQYEAGIDWDQIQGGGPITWGDGINITGNYPSTNIGKGISDPFTTITLRDKFGKLDLDATIDLLERFGTVRTLSSPRLNAMNNQPAVLTFAKNQVYFNIDVEVTPPTSVDGVSTGTTSTSVTSEIQTVPIGIILNLIPSIDLENNEVTLSIRPTLTRIAGTIPDPGLPLQIATLGSDVPDELIGQLQSATNEIPIVEVRELDSIMKAKSGQVMVIGGLMEDDSKNTDEGVPFASDLPVIGNFFKRVSKADRKSELVIFIKPTIVSTNGNSHQVDEELYKKFTTDPRPLAF